MADKVTDEQKHINLSNLPMLPTPVITYGMVHKLECKQERKVTLPAVIDDGTSSVQLNLSSDTLGGAGEHKKDEKPFKYNWNSPCLMILFDGGDINSALHHLVTSLHDPFAENAVATLLVQESVRDTLIERVVEQMHQLDTQVANHPSYVRTLAKLQKLKAETIVGNPKVVPPNATPMLVSDLTHSFLGDGPTGVITMHTFRTPKEATQVNLKETLPYSSVSIWNEKLASAYEVCALLKEQTFMLNCYNVDLTPIETSHEAAKNDVKIVKGYHYETLTINHQRKIIVFAVGTIFAN
ncbi:uncharacterized protein LOC133847467 [Drosophila sulfurigaster albostrigata]|uniref:uncharacterized protein LOC133847467 n=1 Tax=Drosophila sulfurigaster albostrigata TaxID=89887 RepID=UPI002D21C61C|nr:uncharacterized protein LOC133847467 [Drosophila sulfurigaster albostrigata]